MMMWRRAAAVLPGVGVSLLPKLACPLCWPAYAGVLSTVGLSFLVSSRYLFGMTAVVLLVSVAALAVHSRQRHGYGPALVGLAASAAILAGKFYLESPTAMYAGVSVLLAASVWNAWPAKRLEACEECSSNRNTFTN